MLLNCGVGEDSWESLGLQGDPTSPFWRRLVLGVHWKDWCWSWNSNTLATWWEELTHLKRPWFWEGLRAGGEGDDRGWDGWMASPTQRTWVWVDSGSLWWTGRPGVLWFMVLQRVRHDWATELNWTMQLNIKSSFLLTYLCGNSQIWLPWRIFLKYLEWEKLKDQHSIISPNEYWSNTGKPFLQSFDSKGNEPSTTFHRFLSWPTYLLLFHRSHWQWKQTLCHPH